MKPCTGLILILLGLLFKASSNAPENSTKIYYIEVHIEAGAYNLFKELLTGLTVDVNQTATVTNFDITTECNSDPAGVKCSCASNYSWSNEVCQNYTKCCDQNECIFAAPNPKAMCLSKTRVLISGWFNMLQEPFTAEHTISTSATYINAVKKYTDLLESSYSTLGWFDSLEITGFRQGSLITDFVMQLGHTFNGTQLENTTKNLAENMSAEFNLIVTGMTTITKLKAPIPYHNTTNITCNTSQNLANPKWFFQQNANSKLEVTNGTEANVTSNNSSTTVSINKTSEAWKGTFMCDYQSTGSEYVIIYRASLYLDIALLPQITIISEPQFPNCRSNPLFKVTVQCLIPNTTESYNVTWTISGEGYDKVSQQKDQIPYETTEEIPCKYSVVNVSCTFTNRLSTTASANLSIWTIWNNSTVCPEDNGWSEALVNHTAIKLCDSNSVGLQRRECMSNKTWASTIPDCVNKNMSILYQDALNLQRGIGVIGANTEDIFVRLKEQSEQEHMALFANVNVSVEVMKVMKSTSDIQKFKWDVEQPPFQDFAQASSNLLNGSLNNSWVPVNDKGNCSLAVGFLMTIEKFMCQINTTGVYQQKLAHDNLQILISNNITNSSTQETFSSDFGVNVTAISSETFVKIAFKNLAGKLPDTVNNNKTIQSGIVLSVIDLSSASISSISMLFNQNRIKNHEMYCVYLDTNTNISQWSTEGCKWGGADKPNLCTCEHLSAFTIMMAKNPVELLYMEELTYAGLGCSVLSLVVCLVIEFLVWNTVVKTNIAHFRHTVSVNIMICLLIADCSFLAAPTPSSTPHNWCLSLTVMKHFCYLAVFFWMLCLSLGLMHQVIFVFVHLRKKVYLGLCIFLGYVCPLVIVVVTFITYDNGNDGVYYSTETCWLIYESALNGSIHAFLFPVFIIVFVNMFTMVVVISRILKPTLSEGSSHDQKEAARSIIKTIVFLTPTLGITWILGLFVLMLDLTTEPYAQIMNYAFTLFNSFQGFLILLTACLGEKKVRDALVKRFKPQQSKKFLTESSTKMTAAIKKK